MNQMLYDNSQTWDGIPETIFNHYDAMFTDSPSYDDLGVSSVQTLVLDRVTDRCLVI